MILLDVISLLAIGGIVWAIVATVNWSRTRLDSNRTALTESVARESETQKALIKSERALRSIANGSDSPALEASIALDEITNYYDTKEPS